MAGAIELVDGPPADVVERLRALSRSVQAAVAARRAVDPTPDDPFRGLYLGDEEIDRLLTGAVPPIEPTPLGDAGDDADAAGHAGDGRLAGLARRFGLDPVDVQLLLVTVAPDVDSRF